ncbi:AAA family ATPase [Sphingomonas sp.]|uniref:AAA family ATPase n=1 Tax=Sphingomonas sp. TaxID=28214 RepID=UPI0017C84942|nr:AAA family ATPase [Sphingomonas sp.]MBA3512610.1 AAA family ATPase [Sphingomonas sp.]
MKTWDTIEPEDRFCSNRNGITAAALMLKTFDPVSYIVPGYVCEGLTVLAGSPKLGKSWMTLGWALAVATGRPAFESIPVLSGDVLYLALEDNQRRLKKRLLHMGLKDAPERLTFHTHWPDLDNGCLGAVDQWLNDHPDARLIVVDVLAKVRGMIGKESAYEADYRVLSGLQGLAGRYGVAIVVVHHTRKMEADDPFDSVSGTRGLTGAADTVLVLKRDVGTGGTGRVTIYGRGRDIEEIETALEFNRDNGIWLVVGAAHDIAKTSERQAILDVVRASSNPLTAREISDLLGKNYDAVRRCLTRMAQSDEVEKTGRGQYTCPNGPIVPTDASAPAQCDIETHGTGDIDQWSRQILAPGETGGEPVLGFEGLAR